MLAVTDPLLAHVKSKASQDATEIAEVQAFLDGRYANPAVLEIGVLSGGSLLYWHELEPTFVVTVDMHHRSMRDLVIEKMRETTRCYPFVASSHDPDVLTDITAIVETVEQRKFDIIYLDGDHSPNGIRQDYEWYGPLLADGGVILLHDTKSEAGVAEFWEGLQESGVQCVEVHRAAPHDYGTGIIGVDSIA